jgi:hypothetical protein
MKDFEKDYTKDKIEKIYMKNLFTKKKIKDIIKTEEISDDEKGILDNLNIRLFNPIYLYIITFKQIFGKITDNKLYDFSKYSEKCKFGKEYYEKFLELLNNFSNDFPEDIETSIYDNLKEVNIQKKENFLNIKDMMKDLIYDVESKKGFLALLKQSYLLGKLRNSIVRKIFIYIIYL